MMFLFPESPDQPVLNFFFFTDDRSLAITRMNCGKQKLPQRWLMSPLWQEGTVPRCQRFTSGGLKKKGPSGSFLLLVNDIPWEPEKLLGCSRQPPAPSIPGVPGPRCSSNALFKQ